MVHAQAVPCRCDGCRAVRKNKLDGGTGPNGENNVLREHAQTPAGLRQVATRDNSSRLVTDTKLCTQTRYEPRKSERIIEQTLKPVGHQSTNWMVRLVLMAATAAVTSLGTTSPR